MKVTAILILSFACVFSWSAASAASEKVYKWTDEKGRTHYGQRPPSGTQTEVIKPQTGHSDPVNYNATPSEKEKLEKKADAKGVPPKDKDRCENARKNAETLKTYTHIRLKGADGEYRYLTPEEQQQKLDEANKAIQESCE